MKIAQKMSQFMDSLIEAASQFRPTVSSSSKVDAIKDNLYVEYSPTQVELDILKMKGIVLLNNSSLGLPIKEILNSPIEAGAIPLHEGRLEICLSQRFEWLGSKYRLEGRFVKPTLTSSITIPLKNTFRIVKEKTS